jgi:hypothetical protein
MWSEQPCHSGQDSHYLHAHISVIISCSCWALLEVNPILDGDVIKCTRAGLDLIISSLLSLFILLIFSSFWLCLVSILASTSTSATSSFPSFLAFLSFPASSSSSSFFVFFLFSSVHVRFGLLHLRHLRLGLGLGRLCLRLQGVITIRVIIGSVVWVIVIAVVIIISRIAMGSGLGLGKSRVLGLGLGLSHLLFLHLHRFGGWSGRERGESHVERRRVFYNSLVESHFGSHGNHGAQMKEGKAARVSSTAAR